MEDICYESPEHGIDVRLLENSEQGRESGQTTVYADVLQPSVQEPGEFTFSDISDAMAKQDGNKMRHFLSGEDRPQGWGAGSENHSSNCNRRGRGPCTNDVVGVIIYQVKVFQMLESWYYFSIFACKLTPRKGLSRWAGQKGEEEMDYLEHGEAKLNIDGAFSINGAGTCMIPHNTTGLQPARIHVNAKMPHERRSWLLRNECGWHNTRQR